MKKHLSLSLLIALTYYSPVHAQMIDDECDETEMDCREGEIKEPSKKIYPFRPYEIEHIEKRVSALTENSNYVRNIYEMDQMALQMRNTKEQPWGGSYWPLNQGMVANNYQNKDYNTFIFSGAKHFSWRLNVSSFKKRKDNLYPEIMSVEEKELAELAPSEKYDLLLGDTNFDLTNKIWQYAEKWGEEKKWGFLSSIEIPDGYVLPKASKKMALWEGICHGWAVAAGHSPRPEKTVVVTLPDGRRLPFYPNDIKALVSLMWANSTIQSDVIFEGNRCNRKNPDKDRHGRYIDTEMDRDDTELLPRCADVHPGIFHLSLVNILGIEGRSFVIDKDPEAPIANQPLSGYDFDYYNPKTGKIGSLRRSVISVKDYGDKDKYLENRNPNTTHIVGVAMKLKYVDWEFPKFSKTNSRRDDSISETKFDYDLELDKDGNIIGGQWRVFKKIGDGILGLGGKTHQPDFFWVVPRNWKKYFNPVKNLPEWSVTSGVLAPDEFRSAAKSAHSFIYEESAFYFGVSPKCPVYPLEGENGPIKVDCSFRYPKPQPLINVVSELLELSRR